jgi:hypothetical protein
MLKACASVSRSFAVYWYIYVDATYTNACIVKAYVIYFSFSFSSGSVKNARCKEHI